MTRNTSSFDLSAFDSSTQRQDEGIDVEIRHPASGDKVGVTIRVAGPDSAAAKKADRLMVNRRLKSRRTGTLNAEELHEETLLKLAHCTLDWSGMVDKGKPLELTIDNAVLVYRRAPWIMEQVAEVAGDRSRFFES
jgi:hypothetical protein